MDDGERAAVPADRMRSRVPESRWRFWLLLGADRRVVAGSLLAATFLGLTGAGLAHPTPAAELLADGDVVETLFQALLTATITSVTLVLTLGQLVLSQELGAVGDQRERMDGALSFRRDVEEYVEPDVSPAEPSAFLRALVSSSGDRARELADRVGAAGDDDATDGDTTDSDATDSDASGDDQALSGEAADAVRTYADAVAGNADEVTDQLRGASFGEFDVVWAALDFNYSWKIYAGRRLEADHGDALSPAAADALADLLATLELFGPAREHVKTLYFQWELSDLSRVLLFAAVPSLFVSIAALLFLQPAAVPGATLGVSHALVLVAAATTVTLAPFALLLAYVLRIVTVTKRTLSIGPFVLRETADEGE